MIQFIDSIYLIASRIPPGRAVERMSVDDMVQNYCCIERTSATHELHRYMDPAFVPFRIDELNG